MAEKPGARGGQLPGQTGTTQKQPPSKPVKSSQPVQGVPKAKK